MSCRPPPLAFGQAAGALAARSIRRGSSVRRGLAVRAAPDCAILVAAYYILRDAKPHEDLGGDYFIRRETPERLTRHLVRQLERLGQTVTLEPALEAR
jgi:hypothetical protein